MRPKSATWRLAALSLWALPLAGTLLTLLTVISGCSAETRYHMLTALFDDVPKPGAKSPPLKAVVREPRRTPPPPPKPMVAIKALPPPRDWKALRQQLPKVATGEVDWDGALAQKLIEPKTGLAADAPDQAVFDLNVELVPNGQPLFKVIFPHKEHTEWLTCTNCHTGIFQMQRGADPITMAKIFSGEYCGRCHSKVSFDVPTGCPRCHAALAGPK